MATDEKEEVATGFTIKTPGTEERPATEGEVLKLLGTLADPNWYKVGTVEVTDGMGYDKVYTTVDQNPDYTTLLVTNPQKHGMAILRKLFPKGQADEYNIALFSTIGIHTGSVTIEDYESETDPEEKQNGVSFMYVQPRLAHIRLGQCYPVTKDDFDFLKTLRQSSWDVLNKIGRPEEVAMRKDIEGLINGHIDHQILISGHLANQEQWCAVFEALDDQYEMDLSRLEDGVLDKDEVIRFLRTCELLHLIEPGMYDGEGRVQFDQNGKASLK